MIAMEAHRFWDRIANKYYKQPVPSEADYQRKLELTREYFTKDSEVVEFGCGTGTTAVAHAPFVKRLRAVDISERMLAFARQQAADAGVDNLSFSCGTLFDLNLADSSVDVVLGMSILHLLPNRQETLVEVHRILKPGGCFISSTACVALSNSGFKLQTTWVPDSSPMVLFAVATKA